MAYRIHKTLIRRSDPGGINLMSHALFYLPDSIATCTKDISEKSVRCYTKKLVVGTVMTLLVVGHITYFMILDYLNLPNRTLK